MIEYAGVLLVVTVVIALVGTAALRTIGPTLAHDVQCLVQKILGQGGCGAGPAYPVSASTKTVGYSGRVTIVDGGHSYQVTLTKLSNGTSTITVVDTGKLGVSVEASAGVDAGPLIGADAQASAGGGGYGDQRYKWTFPSWAQGQSAYNKISQGSALGLGAHDLVSSTAGSVPFFGGAITHLFDSATGASGAPNQGSLPHKYLTSSSTGAGLQGSAGAKAGVNLLGPQSGVGATINANVGVEQITYGAQKGDRQLVAGLSGTADGALAGVLFGGAQANAAGNIQGQATVTFSPNGTPLTLQINASGDGVWGASPLQNVKAKLPTSSTSASGSSQQGGSGGEGGGAKPPTLTIETKGTGGSGVGTSFTGTIDLTSDPQAQQDVQGFLQGDPTTLGDLINQLNSHGTESLQTYHITRSNTTYGAKFSAGAGVGGQLNDGSSSATYDPPTTRQNGGPWHTAGQ
ncbi:MAG: hypothetical protein JO304_06135 [Solirubrobacterales bacterium]|nr:hypothetical protein [Solirubrobacterales bacterium]